MSKVEEKYPLPEDEHKALVQNLLVSDVLFLIIGVVLAIALTGLRTGDWLASFAFGWFSDYAATFIPTVWMVVVPIALAAIAFIGARLLFPRVESFRNSIISVRQSVNGELPRLPLPQLVGLMLLVGLSEETLFRYGLLGLLLYAFGILVPTPAAQIISLLLSAAIFTLVHNQYNDAWTLGTVFVVGIVLGALYIFTGSLLAVAFTHALYNFIDTLSERHSIMTEPDYYHGKVPSRAILDEIERLQKEMDE